MIRTIAGVFIIGLCLVFSLSSQAKDTNQWSDTTPSINLVHIFSGEINRRGKATGFHHRPDNEDHATARLKSLLSGPNEAGIYTALVEIQDPKSGIWKEKFSSLFPAHLKRKQLVTAILHAFRKNRNKKSRKWKGPSGFGFFIEGYILEDGRIITAYPIYDPDE